MTLEQKIEQMIQYLQLKVLERDWHGVSDAANDIRVLEAKLDAAPKVTQGVAGSYEGTLSPPLRTYENPKSMAATNQVIFPYQQPGFKVLADE